MGLPSMWIRTCCGSSWQKRNTLLVLLTCIVLLLLLFRKEIMNGWRIIFFCDNSTSIDVLLKGSSPLRLWRWLLLALETMDDEAEQMIWMFRVLSPSNIADSPSRGKWEEIESLQPYEAIAPKCPITGNLLRQLEANRGINLRRPF